MSAFVKGQLEHLRSCLFTTCDLGIEVFFSCSPASVLQVLSDERERLFH